ncbi:MAG: conjugative transposon protein TraJ [Bacteroidetes bacterium]|nr:conjugative transposon protein TraJ [Bacteroidota bacterium]
MKWCVRMIAMAIVGIVIPNIVCAQDGGGFADEIRSLHSVLEQLYDDMLPMCSQLIGVGRGIAGFAATWYIAARVWRHIANAEPVDFYPLFRPFVIAFAILIFPSVIAMINGVMKPTVTGTQQMVTDSDKAVAQLLEMKEEAIKKTIYWQMYVGPNGNGDRDKWYKYNYGDESEGWFEGIGNDIRFAFAKFSYNFRNAIKQWMSEVLKVLFEGASLCIDTIRTFYLIVLAILGPLVFGIAVFDGFQHTLTIWIARYINIFLWLPVANIFGAIMGKIQENMLKLDIQQIATQGDTFFSSADTAYLIFMLIGIVGYFTVPSVANYIIHAGGSNTLLYKVSSLATTSTRSVTSRAAQSATSMVKDAYGDMKNMMSGGYQSEQGSYFKDKIKGDS